MFGNILTLITEKPLLFTDVKVGEFEQFLFCFLQFLVLWFQFFTFLYLFELVVSLLFIFTFFLLRFILNFRLIFNNFALDRLFIFAIFIKHKLKPLLFLVSLLINLFLYFMHLLHYWLIFWNLIAFVQVVKSQLDISPLSIDVLQIGLGLFVVSFGSLFDF